MIKWWWYEKVKSLLRLHFLPVYRVRNVASRHEWLHGRQPFVLNPRILYVIPLSNCARSLVPLLTCWNRCWRLTSHWPSANLVSRVSFLCLPRWGREERPWKRSWPSARAVPGNCRSIFRFRNIRSLSHDVVMAKLYKYGHCTVTTITQHTSAVFRIYFIPFRVQKRLKFLYFLSCWHMKRTRLQL